MATLQTSAAGAPAPAAIEIVTFAIGPQIYGLPVAHVLEVVRLPALVTLAGAPPHLCGLLNRRGQQLPVIDGRALAGEPSEYDLSSQIAIIGDLTGCAAGPCYGVLVDRVRDVEAFRVAQVTPLGQGVARPFLSGVIDATDGSILLLDAERLIEMAPRLGEPMVSS